MTESSTGDNYSLVLDLAVRLAEKAAHASDAGLSTPESTFRVSTWIECQVCNGGWEQWMVNTTAEAIRRTIPALEAIGAPVVRRLAEQALAVASINPEIETDKSKDQKLDDLSDVSRATLSALDDAFYESVKLFMSECYVYAQKHGIA